LRRERDEREALIAVAAECGGAMSDHSCRSPQLEMFERLIPASGKTYTQSLELWDQLPKAIVGPVIDPQTGRAVAKGAMYLPTQTKEFIHLGHRMSVEAHHPSVCERNP